MSWKEDIEQDLVIITPDGETYTPLFRMPSKSTGTNAVSVEYNDIQGAEIFRGKLSFKVFSMEMYFQGEDHLDVVKRFEISAEDTRPWTMIHPYYGEFLVQPVSDIVTNNKADNVTIVTVDLGETIGDKDRLESDKDAYLKAQEDVDASEESISESASELTVSEAEKQTLIQRVSEISGILKTGAISEIDIKNINTAIAETNQSLNNIGSGVEIFFSRMAYLFRAPSRFLNTINNRIDNIAASYKNMKDAATGAISLADKIFFEKAGALSIISIAWSAASKLSDIASSQGVIPAISAELRSKKDVYDKIARVQGLYVDYMGKIAELQSEKDNKPDSYYPDIDTIRSVNKAVYSVIGNLLQIANNARQEKTYLLERDYAFIELVGLLYGNYETVTVFEFIDLNDFEISQLFILKKGIIVNYLQ